MKALNIVILILLFPIFSFSQYENAFFEPADWSYSDLTAKQQERIGKIKNYYSEDDIINVDFGTLINVQNDGKLEIKVPGDDCEKVVFTAKEVKYLSDKEYSWYGVIEQNFSVEDPCVCDDGYVLIMKRNNDIFGTIQLENRSYTIEPLSANRNVILREPAESTKTQLCGVEENTSEAPTGLKSLAESRANGNCTVDVLFVYTQSVGANLADPESRARSILTTTNTALSNSGIGIDELRLRFAGAEEVGDIDETGMSPSQVLSAITNSNDADDLRNALNADIVLLLVNQNIANLVNSMGQSVSGQAWVGPNPNLPYAWFRAFNVGTTPAHEIGHLFGCRHEPCTALNAGDNCNDPELQPRQAHSYVYEDECGDEVEEHTIVFSYGSDKRVLQYSNPNQQTNGVARGIAGERDNTQWLKDNACTVANFMSNFGPLTAGMSIGPTDNDCAYADLFIYAQISGGCPGPYTWQWFKSYDGVNYQHLAGFDNQDLDDNTYFEGEPGDITYYRLNATSACGEQAVAFGQVYTIEDCWDGIASDSPIPGGTLTALPNPMIDQNLAFGFELNTKSAVHYEIMDIHGKTIIKEDLGILYSGKYKHQTSIGHSSAGILFLKLTKGAAVETIKVLRTQ